VLLPCYISSILLYSLQPARYYAHLQPGNKLNFCRVSFCLCMAVLLPQAVTSPSVCLQSVCRCCGPPAFAPNIRSTHTCHYAKLKLRRIIYISPPACPNKLSPHLHAIMPYSLHASFNNNMSFKLHHSCLIQPRYARLLAASTKNSVILCRARSDHAELAITFLSNNMMYMKVRTSYNARSSTSKIF